MDHVDHEMVPYGSPDEEVPYEVTDHDWHEIGGES